MNNRMEQEVERTVALLRASLPEEAGSLPAPLWVAAGEIRLWHLLVLWAGTLLVGVSAARVLSRPMLAAFCTAPVPMLLLFHRYVLGGNEALRELEETLPYSYSHMLLARTTVISCHMLATLLCLALALHRWAGEDFLRLALCGAAPSLSLCALLLFLSSRVRNQDALSLTAMVLWAALCFTMLQLSLNDLLRFCPTAVLWAAAALGAGFYGICFHDIQRRRNLYAIRA